MLSIFSFDNTEPLSEETDIIALNDNRRVKLSKYRRFSDENGNNLFNKEVCTEENVIVNDAKIKQKIAIDVDNVTYSYSINYGFSSTTVSAVKNINVRVPQGKIYALLGASGCGKTTLLKCVLGRLKPVCGNILVYGKKPGSTHSPIPGLGVGYMPQELALFPDFTIMETLRYFGQLYRMSSKEIESRTKFLIKLLHLPENSRLICKLSGGQQRRVSLAAALVHHPPLLVLDEPTVGVDPVLRRAIWEHLETLCRDDQLTVIITTHYIEEARAAETVGLMRFGRLLVEENPESLLERHSLPTLEAVFLKLCEMDSSQYNSNINNADSNKITIEQKNCSNSEQTKDITIDQESTSMTKMNSTLSIQKLSDFSPEINQLSSIQKASLSQNIQYATIDSTRQRIFDPSRVHALLIKNIIRLMRNVPVLVFFLFLPSIQLALFCICIGPDPKNLTVAVYNAENPPKLSNEYLYFVDKEIVNQVPYATLESARKAVFDGEVWAVLHFSHNYTYAMNKRRKLKADADNNTINSSNIKVYIDMSNQVNGYVLVRSFFLGFQEFAKKYLVTLGFNPAAVTLPIVVEETIYGHKWIYNPSLTAFMAPGILLLIAFYATTALTTLSLVLERKDGLLERSCVAGVNAFEFLTSHMITQISVLTIQVILMLFTTFYLFNVPAEGPMFWIFILTLLQGVAGVMFGLFISSICANEVNAAIIGMGALMPTIFLGGIFWPIQSMPNWMYHISSFLPQSLPVEAMRIFLSRGWGIAHYEVILGFIVTIAWIFIYLLFALFIFRKYVT